MFQWSKTVLNWCGRCVRLISKLTLSRGYLHSEFTVDYMLRSTFIFELGRIGLWDLFFATWDQMRYRADIDHLKLFIALMVSNLVSGCVVCNFANNFSAVRWSIKGRKLLPFFFLFITVTLWATIPFNFWSDCNRFIFWIPKRTMNSLLDTAKTVPESNALIRFVDLRVNHVIEQTGRRLLVLRKKHRLFLSFLELSYFLATTTYQRVDAYLLFLHFHVLDNKLFIWNL